LGLFLNYASLRVFLNLILVVVLELWYLLIPILKQFLKDLTLVIDAHLVNISISDAILLIQVCCKEASSAHMILCFILIPIFLVLLVFNRSLVSFIVRGI